MLFKDAILREIEGGRVTLAFRRWTKPTVRTGGTLRTAVGVLSIESVEPVRPDDIDEEAARRAGYGSRAALLSELFKRPDGTLYRIEFRLAEPDPRKALRERRALGADDLSELRARLSALDKKSRSGPWTAETLSSIAGKDGITAQEIAERLRLEKSALKRKVRLLKELGLTESLPSGYRLSERGRAFCSAVLSG